MESVSLDDVRLLHGMIDDHQAELLQERTRLDGLRLEWTRKLAVANQLRAAGQLDLASARFDEAQALYGQIAEVERRIARLEELIGILRRRQQAL